MVRHYPTLQHDYLSPYLVSFLGSSHSNPFLVFFYSCLFILVSPVLMFHWCFLHFYQLFHLPVTFSACRLCVHTFAVFYLFCSTSFFYSITYCIYSCFSYLSGFDVLSSFYSFDVFSVTLPSLNMSLIVPH